MKSIYSFLVFIGMTGFTNAQFENQVEDTLPKYFGGTVEIYDKDFLRQYKYLKPRVLKVYPYALYAADLLDEMNNNLASIEKRRKKSKFTKKSYQKLKEEFKYVLLDMYISEGQVLMKLIARETGMTVHEIIGKYRGAKNATMFNLMGKMFEQDIKTKYNAQKEYVLEAIIKDIESGKIEFDDTVETLHKEEYKQEKKDAKKRRKANHKKIKAKKKQDRKKKRKRDK
jgi:hypothetical protein